MSSSSNVGLGASEAATRGTDRQPIKQTAAQQVPIDDVDDDDQDDDDDADDDEDHNGEHDEELLHAEEDDDNFSMDMTSSNQAFETASILKDAGKRRDTSRSNAQDVEMETAGDRREDRLLDEKIRNRYLQELGDIFQD